MDFQTESKIRKYGLRGLGAVFRDIARIIGNDTEGLEHDECVLKEVMNLDDSLEPDLIIAAYGHDAVRVPREHLGDFQQRFEAANRSAELVSGIVMKHYGDREVADNVRRLIANHEIGSKLMDPQGNMLWQPQGKAKPAAEIVASQIESERKWQERVERNRKRRK